MFDQIEAALSLIDRFKKARAAKREPREESIALRFFRIFEKHGVSRNQIPRFFGHNLTIEDVQTEESLFSKLTESVLNGVCEQFAIRREWLDGADTQPHTVHRFYKKPGAFSDFIQALRAANPEFPISGVVVAPFDARSDGAALVILEEEIGWVGDKAIFRYHLCDNWPFSYWKARAYLTACVAIAWKSGIYIHGVKAKSKEISLLSEGKTLMGWNGQGVYEIARGRWDPEDMALWPKQFLAGVDAEHENFGIRSGVELWLSLERDGFMDTGLTMYKRDDIRARFERVLTKEK